jgi:hypothetical protein
VTNSLLSLIRKSFRCARYLSGPSRVRTQVRDYDRTDKVFAKCEETLAGFSGNCQSGSVCFAVLVCNPDNWTEEYLILIGFKRTVLRICTAKFSLLGGSETRDRQIDIVSCNPHFL